MKPSTFFSFTLLLSNISPQAVPLRNPAVKCLNTLKFQDNHSVYGILTLDKISSSTEITKALEKFTSRCHVVINEKCNYINPNRKDHSHCSSFTLKELTWSQPVSISDIQSCGQPPCTIQPNQTLLTSLHISRWKTPYESETDSLLEWLHDATTLEISYRSLYNMSAQTYVSGRYRMWMKILYVQVKANKRFSSRLTGILKPREVAKEGRVFMKSSTRGYIVKIGLKRFE